MMNEAYQAHDGLPPDLFPPDLPTYTGARAALRGKARRRARRRLAARASLSANPGLAA